MKKNADRFCCFSYKIKSLVLLITLSSCKAQSRFGNNTDGIINDSLDSPLSSPAIASEDDIGTNTTNSKSLVSITSGAASVVGNHLDSKETTTWKTWASADIQDNLPYDPAKSAKNNHSAGNSQRANLPDVTISSPDGQIHITSAVALAGAIASVKYKGQELIHTTHGAAFQYHVRYSDIGWMHKSGLPVYFNECDNPTEAGNTDNDAGIPDWLGESSSYLMSYGSKTVNGIQELNSVNNPTDFTAPQKWSTVDYGSGLCFNDKKDWFTGFILEKQVRAGWDSPITEKRYNNVIEMTGKMTVPKGYSKKVVQLELIAYLRRWAWYQWEYAAVTNTLTPKNGETPLGGDDGYAKIFSNQDQSFAMGMLSFHKKGETQIASDTYNQGDVQVSHAQQPVTYTNGDAQGGHAKRIIQTNWQFNYPTEEQVKTTHSFIVLGTLEEVKNALQDIYQSALQNPKFETKDNASKLVVKLGKGGGDVTGAVTNHYLDKNSGSYIVEGWACQENRHESIAVHPYYGSNFYDSANPGKNMNAPFLANQSMNELASTTCKTNGIPHGFRFEMGKEILPSLAGQPIYLHAISNIPNATHWALHGTDKVIIPTFGLGGKLEAMWLDQNTGGLVLQGWACAAGLKSSVDVHIHINDQFHSSMLANLSDGHVGTTSERCGTSGVLHGFRFLLTKKVTMEYVGKEIKLYAMSPGKSARLEKDGYGIPPYYIALKSYWKDSNQSHLVHTSDEEAARLGYVADGNLGYLFTGHNNEYPSGAKILYSCWVAAWGRAFPTTDASECTNNGGSAAGLGYLVSSSTTLGGARPLRRCYKNSALTADSRDTDDHMLREQGQCPLFYAEEGGRYHLGYAIVDYKVEVQEKSYSDTGKSIPKLAAGQYILGQYNSDGTGNVELIRAKGDGTFCFGPRVDIRIADPRARIPQKLIRVTQRSEVARSWITSEQDYEAMVRGARKVESFEMGTFGNCYFN